VATPTPVPAPVLKCNGDDSLWEVEADATCFRDDMPELGGMILPEGGFRSTVGLEFTDDVIVIGFLTGLEGDTVR